MRTKQFKAESKRLLDLMIHSIYTHKEIFLRELISNASDAMDKLYYRSLKEHLQDVDREDFAIDIAVDKEHRTLTLWDTGIGMTEEELDNNLGVIAKSGSYAFKNEQEQTEDVDIIGQFGVGFYSAFMVSDLVTVVTRAYGSDQAYRWESKGVQGYTIEPCDKDTVGTQIILHIKENTEEENYDEFLESYRLQHLIRKYSDYIRYPIRMDVESRRPVEGKEGEFETITETKTINSMVPLWRKNKSEVTDEDYNAFYKDKFMDHQDPARVIHSRTEGNATYQALLFIPSHAPYDYYTREYEKGLQLYASGVLIMDKCGDLLPDYFSFVKGLVDSQDLSLNISREMLQHDRQLKLIASRLEKKIASELTAMLNNDRETYEEFFKNFGLQLKYGIHCDFGIHQDELKDLLLFCSSYEKKMTTLREYVDRMPEGQPCIYYACGDSPERIERMPQIEAVRDKGYEVLYLTDDVDEFALKALQTYADRAFQSVSSGDLGLDEDEDKEDAADYADLFGFMTGALGGKVTAVKASHRLKTHPVCLITEGEVSLEMEKVLGAMPGDNRIKAQRVLEINETHPLFQKLVRLYDEDKDTLTLYTGLLYDQAAMMEGLLPEDPVTFTQQMCAMMAGDQ